MKKSKPDNRNWRLAVLAKKGTKPFYTPADLDECARLIQFKNPDDEWKLPQRLEDLTFGLLDGLSREDEYHPKIAADKLEKLSKAISRAAPALENIDKAFDNVKREQAKSGCVRQLLPSTVVDWDSVDDLSGAYSKLRSNIDGELARFRAATKTSPLKVRPELQWGEAIFNIWKCFDERKALGKRDGEGRFRRFLEAASQPIGIKIVWTTLYDRIKRGLENSKKKPNGRRKGTK